MIVNRRALIRTTSLGVALAAVPALSRAASTIAASPTKVLAEPPPPIAAAERVARIAKVQSLIRANGMGAVFIEAGPSLAYFSGVSWGRTERLTGIVIPGIGQPLVITPHFEEASVRESLVVPATVRTWHEDEDPLAVVGGWLREAKLHDKAIGVEETVRQFLIEGLGNAVPQARLISANPVVRRCRMIKSPAEIALMQHASDITIAAYARTIPAIRSGMSQGDIENAMTKSMAELGGARPWALALVGEASAYPHGSKNPKSVADNDIVLMDCGCGFRGYQADISRTFAFGTPTPDHRKFWSAVRRGQEIAFAAAQIGSTAGSVDRAVRAFYERLGYGPGYKLPGLSHRTGHGIGMETHDPINLVANETTRLETGMCFSNEPGLYAPGRFGVRLEDCFYMTTSGPRWFSQPSVSIEVPV